MASSFSVTATGFSNFKLQIPNYFHMESRAPVVQPVLTDALTCSLLWPAAISTRRRGDRDLLLQGAHQPAVSLARKSGWRVIYFSFFQDGFWPAYLPKLSCGWTCLCKKATGASWNTDFALMRNHIFSYVSLTLRGESAQAENLCGPGWNQHCLIRRNTEKSQDLETWSQMLVSCCSLYSFGHAAPRRSGAPQMPASPSSHVATSSATSTSSGVTQTSLTDYNWNELYANRLGQSQVIKLPVTGPI